MMAGITIRVDPDVLKAKAMLIDSRISSVEKELKDIGERMACLKNDWDGEAGILHRKRFMDLQDEMLRVIGQLKKHPKKLLTMAGLYSATESELQAVAGRLPGHVIR